MFVWSQDQQQIVLGKAGSWTCNGCGAAADFYLLELATQTRLWGIRLGKPSVGHQLECSNCHGRWFVSEKDVAAMVDGANPGPSEGESHQEPAR